MKTERKTVYIQFGQRDYQEITDAVRRCIAEEGCRGWIAEGEQTLTSEVKITFRREVDEDEENPLELYSESSVRSAEDDDW